MVAEVETIEKVSALAEKYKYGFVTDIEIRVCAKRAERRYCPLYLRQERMSLNGCWIGA